MIIGAFTAVGGPDSLDWHSFAAVAVGIGTSLVLDEFALILHLQDVYWSGEGQLSVEAVSLTAACLGLALAGFSPLLARRASRGRHRSGPAVATGSERLERATRRSADFDRRWTPLQSDWENFIGGKPSQPNPPAPVR